MSAPLLTNRDHKYLSPLDKGGRSRGGLVTRRAGRDLKRSHPQNIFVILSECEGSSHKDKLKILRFAQNDNLLNDNLLTAGMTKYLNGAIFKTPHKSLHALKPEA
jgi:hypothetical protein